MITLKQLFANETYYQLQMKNLANAMLKQNRIIEIIIPSIANLSPQSWAFLYIFINAIVGIIIPVSKDKYIKGGNSRNAKFVFVKTSIAITSQAIHHRETGITSEATASFDVLGFLLFILTFSI